MKHTEGNTPYCSGKLTTRATETLDNLIAENGNTIAQWVEYNNALRLVACWNACEGIDIEDIELINDMDIAQWYYEKQEDLQSSLSTLEGQLAEAEKANTELVAELRNAREHINYAINRIEKGTDNDS